MLKQTPLYLLHQAAGAKLVDFAGWEMPISYGSQLDEHHAVRRHAGMFDVSHMGVLDITGPDVKRFLRYVLANDVAKLTTPGHAVYTCMLNPMGGVIDDLIVYWLDQEWYRIVLNASRRQTDYQWLLKVSEEFEVTLRLRPELCILAVQGPCAISKVKAAFSQQWQERIDSLQSFGTCVQDDIQMARTGYTGEDGLEIIALATDIMSLWHRLLALAVQPCGLGARDTLRLEAGLNLYGNDMDEDITPYEANLAWTVSLKDTERDFVGKEALLKQKAEGVEQQLVGIVMPDRGVLRNHQKVYLHDGTEGEITSGSFSPTLGCAIAFARLPKHITGEVMIDRRGVRVPVMVVKPPFVKQGEKAYESLS